jgi:hypothetical protein
MLAVIKKIKERDIERKKIPKAFLSSTPLLKKHTHIGLPLHFMQQKKI